MYSFFLNSVQFKKVIIKLRQSIPHFLSKFRLSLVSGNCLTENKKAHIFYFFQLLAPSYTPSLYLLKILLLYRILVASPLHMQWIFFRSNTSHHLLISPAPINLPNSLPSPYHSSCLAPQQQRVTLERNEIDRQSRM